MLSSSSRSSFESRATCAPSSGVLFKPRVDITSTLLWGEMSSRLSLSHSNHHSTRARKRDTKTRARVLKTNVFWRVVVAEHKGNERERIKHTQRWYYLPFYSYLRGENSCDFLVRVWRKRKKNGRFSFHEKNNCISQISSFLWYHNARSRRERRETKKRRRSLLCRVWSEDEGAEKEDGGESFVVGLRLRNNPCASTTTNSSSSSWFDSFSWFD